MLTLRLLSYLTQTTIFSNGEISPIRSNYSQKNCECWQYAEEKNSYLF